MRIGITLTACALLMAAPPFVHAQESPRAVPYESAAEALIEHGIDLRRHGEDADALAAFEQAYALRPSARAAAQIALAHQAMGHWLEAEPRLLEALRGSDDAADRAWIDHYRIYLEQSLTTVQSHLAWVDVDVNADGAEVWIEGRPMGKLPLDHPLRVVAGEVTVELRSPGREPVRQMLRIPAASVTRAAFALGSPATDSSGAHESDALGAKKPATSPLADRAAGARRTVGWIAAASAGGLLVTGIAAQALREYEVGIYNDDSRCGPLGAQTRYDRCAAHRDLGSAAQSVAIAAYVGAALSGATAAVLLLGGSRSVAARSPTRFACTIGVAGLGCAGRF